jgi:hypothetical protein
MPIPHFQTDGSPRPSMPAHIPRSCRPGRYRVNFRSAGSRPLILKLEPAQTITLFAGGGSIVQPALTFVRRTSHQMIATATTPSPR